jgi:hypothetical protein
VISRNLHGCDVFFLTYDEPHADARWDQLKARLPFAQRVHGIKGFDAAYKECARRASTDRFFSIDGDNEILPAFTELQLDMTQYDPGAVLSWSALNPVNGLRYGNGGIKNWPKHVVLGMRTHETSEAESDAVEFCYKLNYFQMSETLSSIMAPANPYQAFRAGFREGVKMCLDRGHRPGFTAGAPGGIQLADYLPTENLNRLRIWCSVGADMEFGLWSMCGARLGCYKTCLSDWPFHAIRDYEWMRVFWEEEIHAKALANSGGPDAYLLDQLEFLEGELNGSLNLGITSLSADASVFFKRVYINPPRGGLMFR